MKKTLIAILLAALLCTFAVAQQPATQTAPPYPVNASWVNGIAPGYAPTAGAGLTLNLSSGTAFCSGTVQTYAGGTLTLTGSTTNYIYLNTASNCTPSTKTTAFTISDIPLAVVVTGSSTITSITDDRTMMTHGSIRQCEVAWGGTGSGNALQAGDDGVAANSCMNETAVTQTIVAVYCRSDSSTGGPTVAPTFGTNGTGTGILGSALACGPNNGWLGTWTIANASLLSGNGINPVMGGTYASATNLHLLIVYTQP